MSMQTLTQTVAQTAGESRTRDKLGAELSSSVAYLFAAPSFFLLIASLVLPIIVVVLMSFTDFRLGETGIEWIGFRNYTDIIADRVFRNSLFNTCIYVVIVVPGSVMLGLLLAVMIEGLSKGKWLYRMIFFLPVTSTMVAMSLVWKYLFHSNIGPFNLLLQALGLPILDFFNNTSLVLLGLAIINIWSLSGFNMVLFAAGLTAVPEELYDAASVDGMDGALDRFFGVTLPLLGPTLMFVIVTSTVTAFKVFDTVAVITRGGPRGASDVLLYTTYLESFSYLRMGSGAAMTVVFLVIILFFALLQARVLDKKVHY